MPLRSDPSLWFNLPGVVAAYQPVMAPDSLLARYNQAHGGDNRYRAEPGKLPAWTATGWIFTGGAVGQQYYLLTGVSVDTATQGNWTIIVRSHPTATGPICASGNYFTGIGIHVYNYGSSVLAAANDGKYNTFGTMPSALPFVMAIAGRLAYINGLLATTIASAGATAATQVAIGRDGASGSGYFTGKIQTMAIYSRLLSPAEVWLASRQMAYCDVNPTWSAWGRRRQWYYGPQVAGFQAAWAAHTNRLIGGGN